MVIVYFRQRTADASDRVTGRDVIMANLVQHFLAEQTMFSSYRRRSLLHWNHLHLNGTKRYCMVRFHCKWCCSSAMWSCWAEHNLDYMIALCSMSRADGRARESERLMVTANASEKPATVMAMVFALTETAECDRLIYGDSTNLMRSKCCRWKYPTQWCCCDANSYWQRPMCAACVLTHAMWTDAGDGDGDDGKRAMCSHRALNCCLISWSVCSVPTRTATMIGKKIAPNSCCSAAISSID